MVEDGYGDGDGNGDGDIVMSGDLHDPDRPAFTPQETEFFNNHIRRRYQMPGPGHQLRVSSCPPACPLDICFGEFAVRFLQRKQGGGAANIRSTERRLGHRASHKGKQKSAPKDDTSVGRFKRGDTTGKKVEEKKEEADQSTITASGSEADTEELVARSHVPIARVDRIFLIPPPIAMTQAGMAHWMRLLHVWRSLFKHLWGADISTEVYDEATATALYTAMTNREKKHVVFLATGCAVTRHMFSHRNRRRTWLLQTESFMSNRRRSEGEAETSVSGRRKRIGKTDLPNIDRLLSVVSSRVECVFESDIVQYMILRSRLRNVHYFPGTCFATSELLHPVSARTKTQTLQVESRKFRYAFAVLGGCSPRQLLMTAKLQAVTDHLGMASFTGVPATWKRNAILSQTSIIVLLHTGDIMTHCRDDVLPVTLRRARTGENHESTIKTESGPEDSVVTLHPTSRAEEAPSPIVDSFNAWLSTYVGMQCEAPPIILSESLIHPDLEAPWKGGVMFSDDVVQTLHMLLSDTDRMNILLDGTAAFWAEKRSLDPAGIINWWNRNGASFATVTVPVMRK